jgi:general secretion pathway protein J
VLCTPGGDRPLTRAPKGTAGFTLLELLVAMVVLGLLAVALANGLRLGARSWDAIETRHGASTDFRLTRTLLREWLSQAQSLTATAEESDNDSKLVFDGQLHKVMFAAALTPRFGRGGMFTIEFELENGRDGRRLVMVQRRFPPVAADGDSTIERRVLLDNIATAEFAYYGAEDNDEPTWRREWREAPALPRLIRLAVDFRAGDPRAWPDFVAAPVLDVRGGGLRRPADPNE